MGICESRSGETKNNTNNIPPIVIHFENNGVKKPEIMFDGIHSHIPDEKLAIISNQKEKKYLQNYNK